MRPAIVNFYVPKGGDLVRPLTVYVMNRVVRGDLDSISWTISSDDPDDMDIVRFKGSGVFFDPSNPQILALTLKDNHTSGMSFAKRYRHEMKVTIDGRIFVPMQGTLHLT